MAATAYNPAGNPVLSFWVCDLAGKFYQEPDDGRIVIDELIATWWHRFLPFPGRQHPWIHLVPNFDILKPPPVSWFDREMKTVLASPWMMSQRASTPDHAAHLPAAVY